MLLSKVIKLIEYDIPGFAIKYKAESWLMKIIGILIWPINRRFMTNYSTTIYPVVYLPSRKYMTEYPDVTARILMHEYVHLWDRKQLGPLFSFAYLLPQGLTPVFLAYALVWLRFDMHLGVVIFFILFGICLLPLPAYWRMRYEVRAYCMVLVVHYWITKSQLPMHDIDKVQKQFTGWAYYKMWPFRNDILQRFENQLRDILDGTMESEARKAYYPYHQVKAIIQDCDNVQAAK